VNKITKGKSIGMILLAALMACAMLVPAASALASTPANPTDRCDPPVFVPPSRPYPADGVEVQDYSPLPGSTITLEPSYSWGEAYQAHGTHGAPYPHWPGCVVGRADTEAFPKAGVTTTRVWVRVTLWRWNADLQRWEWQDSASNFTTQREWCWEYLRWMYDTDAYAGGPWLGPAWYAVTATHRVFRDGVLTASASQMTSAVWVWTPITSPIPLP